MQVLIPISFFATVFGIAYVYFTTRHKERMALIEKGIDASIFYPNEKSILSRIYNKPYSLQFGIVGVCLGLAVLLGNVLNRAGMNAEAAYNAPIFLMGGIGLIIFHIINRKYQKGEKSDKA